MATAEEIDQRLRDFQREYIDFLDDGDQQGIYSSLVRYTALLTIKVDYKLSFFVPFLLLPSLSFFFQGRKTKRKKTLQMLYLVKHLILKSPVIYCRIFLYLSKQLFIRVNGTLLELLVYTISFFTLSKFFMMYSMYFIYLLGR